MTAERLRGHDGGEGFSTFSFSQPGRSLVSSDREHLTLEQVTSEGCARSAPEGFEDGQAFLLHRMNSCRIQELRPGGMVSMWR